MPDHIADLLRQSYSYDLKDNRAIDRDIEYNQRVIEWNTRYIEYLTKGKVSFDQPVWKDDDFDSNIIEDFYMIAKSINNLTKGESERLYGQSCWSFDELRSLLQKYGYVDSKGISAKLIELCGLQNKDLEEEIEKLLKKKISKDAADKLTYMLGIAPAAENTDKILKYERSLQKSIFQNLFVLKKLQGMF